MLLTQLHDGCVPAGQVAVSPAGQAHEPVQEPTCVQRRLLSGAKHIGQPSRQYWPAGQVSAPEPG